MTEIEEARLASTLDVQRLALQHVLDSPCFRRNPRLAALLSYLCRRAEEVSGEPPKEYSIATDVFGRSGGFDSSTDSIVRVEMHRLRKKLREFYQTEGVAEPLWIVLEAGVYRPHYIPAKPADRPAEAPLVAETSTLEPLLIPSASQKPPRGRSRHNLIYGAVCLALLGFLITGVQLVRRPSAILRMPRTIPAAVRAADARGEIRILAGTAEDRYFSGGTVVHRPDAVVFRTTHPDIYRSARTGDFSYDIPLPPGPHEMRLHFAETSPDSGTPLEGGENRRLFGVFANGNLLLQGFDIAADAGPDTADIKVFEGVERDDDGKLHLSFVHTLGVPLLNAIEISPRAPNQIAPIRIATQEAGFRDGEGRYWSPDDFFLRGRISYHVPAPQLKVPVDRIYRKERYGHFSYALPVPAGRYTVILHFLEDYWGPFRPGGGGVGSRVFDVYCNGQTLLKNLDVFREAGAEHALVKSSSGIEPNAQGKILLSFVPVKNYAMVSAIEVIASPSR